MQPGPWWRLLHDAVLLCLVGRAAWRGDCGAAVCAQLGRFWAQQQEEALLPIVGAGRPAGGSGSPAAGYGMAPIGLEGAAGPGTENGEEDDSRLFGGVSQDGASSGFLSSVGNAVRSETHGEPGASPRWRHGYSECDGIAGHDAAIHRRCVTQAATWWRCSLQSGGALFP
jgi:hypothetical protein